MLWGFWYRFAIWAALQEYGYLTQSMFIFIFCYGYFEVQQKVMMTSFVKAPSL
jgi:uncharacterized membrane protein